MRLDNAQMKTEGLNLLWSKAPLQMKTLKSQLRLSPSYNELIKEITKEEYKNKNERDVIDRNAFYFRDSPLGTVYDNNTVDLRQQHFQKILEQPKTLGQFDIAKDDEMDGLRDGAIQTLSATMDDAEEQHEQQISQMSEDFQLHLRGFQMTPEQQAKYDSLKTKGKGKDQAKKQYLINVIEELISIGKWTTKVNDELLRKRMEEWRDMKGKGKASKS